MNDSKELRNIMEAFYNSAPYHNMSQEPEEKESVTYSKTKKKGDASVTVSANADSMEELHDILRLAGIDFDHKDNHDVDHGEEHDCDDDCPEDCPDCDGEEHGMDDHGTPKMIMIKPKDDSYNPIAGNKKEILNALMNRYKSI